MNQFATRIYRFAEMEVDSQQSCLRHNGQELHLRRKTFEVLLYLLAERHRLVTKDELVGRVWGDTAVTDDAVVKCIVDLRKALGDDPHQPRFIKTVSKGGYRFIAPVEELAAEPETEERRLASNGTGVVHAEATNPLTTSPLRRLCRIPRRGFVWLVALLLIAGSGVYFYRNRQARRAEITLPPIPGKRAVAVLFFENRSRNHELDWLCEGLADMLIANLSRAPKLAVLSRQQLAVLLGRAGHKTAEPLPLEDALEIARKVQAEVMAWGSFAQLGEKVRLDVQLHDARTGRLLVTESANANSPAEVLTQVDLLALKLAGHLGATAPEPAAQVAAQMTNSLDAYRYYSLALEQTQMFQFAEAIALLEKAIALDPQFAMAHARIGYVYAVKWLDNEKAKPYLAKALSLADRLSEKDKLFVTAWAAVADNDGARASEIYRAIIARYPLETEAYERLGLALYRQGKWEEALPIVQQGLATDAERKELYNILGYLCLRLGRRDEGVAAFQHYIQLAPNDPNAYDSLGSLQQWFGAYDEAQTAYQWALALNPELHNAIIHLGNLYVWQGRYAAALEQYRCYVQVARSDAQRSRGYGCQAWVWLRKGEVAQTAAASALEKKYAGQTLVWTPVELAWQRGDTATAARLAEPHFSAAELARMRERGFLRIHFVWRGKLALKSGRADEALEHFRAALGYAAAEWNIDSFEDCLANALLEVGRNDEAIAEYERILKINSNYPLVQYHLGQAHDHKGDHEKARAAYQRFLQVWREADADIPEILAAQQRLAQP